MASMFPCARSVLTHLSSIDILIQNTCGVKCFQIMYSGKSRNPINSPFKVIMLRSECFSTKAAELLSPKLLKISY